MNYDWYLFGPEHRSIGLTIEKQYGQWEIDLDFWFGQAILYLGKKNLFKD